MLFTKAIIAGLATFAIVEALPPFLHDSSDRGERGYSTVKLPSLRNATGHTKYAYYAQRIKDRHSEIVKFHKELKKRSSDPRAEGSSCSRPPLPPTYIPPVNTPTPSVSSSNVRKSTPSLSTKLSSKSSRPSAMYKPVHPSHLSLLLKSSQNLAAKVSSPTSSPVISNDYNDFQAVSNPSCSRPPLPPTYTPPVEKPTASVFTSDKSTRSTSIRLHSKTSQPTPLYKPVHPSNLSLLKLSQATKVSIASISKYKPVSSLDVKSFKSSQTQNRSCSRPPLPPNYTPPVAA
ncbi:hypothetical protein K7432_012971 [Basidiobolus ranarum]|uniref:Uncharacterized protein n=1 Tax=Basidiobolus ranarum TaxID=34480 RepID=A0ABR2WK52_9FUNG